MKQMHSMCTAHKPLIGASQPKVTRTSAAAFERRSRVVDHARRNILCYDAMDAF